jgi:hypothetical protein
MPAGIDECLRNTEAHFRQSDFRAGTFGQEDVRVSQAKA